MNLHHSFQKLLDTQLALAVVVQDAEELLHLLLIKAQQEELVPALRDFEGCIKFLGGHQATTIFVQDFKDPLEIFHVPLFFLAHLKESFSLVVIHDLLCLVTDDRGHKVQNDLGGDRHEEETVDPNVGLLFLQFLNEVHRVVTKNEA